MTAIAVLRWGVAGIFFGGAALSLVLNYVWAREGRLAREKGERGPSLVPLVAPILAIVGSLMAPQGIVALVVPLVIVLDVGTIRLGRLLLDRTQKPR